MRGWQANKKRTCALPVKVRAMPETEIPPAIAGGYLLVQNFKIGVINVWNS